MVDWSGAGRRGMSEAAQQRLAALGVNLAGAPRDDASSIEGPALEGTTAGAGRHRAEPLPGRRRVTAAVEDRLPVGARAVAARGTVSGHHVAVLAILLAGLLALTAWWVISARAQPEPVRALAPAAPLPSVSAPAGPDGTGAASEPSGSPASADISVIVDVAGKVRRPGIVTLPLGARVVDALKAAGGVRPSVDLTSLNLARELVDGEQLLVGLAPPPGLPPPSGAVPSGAPPGPVALVDLNTATMAELDTLPGVGPVTAQAILGWRAEHGGFSSVDELLEIDGIGEATLADLRDLVTV